MTTYEGNAWKIERVMDGDVEYIAVIDMDGIAIKYYSFTSPDLCDELWYTLSHLVDYSAESLYAFRLRKNAAHCYEKGSVCILCE